MSLLYPSDTSALHAEKFCANPTAATTCPSSCAFSTLSKSKEALAIGKTFVPPPTVVKS